MEKKVMALLIIGVMLLASIAFPQVVVDAYGTYLSPIIYTLNNKTVKIGVIWATPSEMSANIPYYRDIIKLDINNYCKKLGYNVRFDFVYMNAWNGQYDQWGNQIIDAATHLKRVQELKRMGIDLVIGGPWSSLAQGSLDYINKNGMVMFSKSSTSPTLAIANDNLFRMCTTDGELAPALVEMLWSYGIKSVVIIQRGDTWGDGIVNLFKPQWTAKGGNLAGDTIRYDTGTTDFTNYLALADAQEAAAESSYPGKVGVVLLSFDEGATILQQAASYHNIYDHAKWFGGDGTANTPNILANAGQQAAHVKLFSLMTTTPSSSKYNNLATRYTSVTGQQFNVYTSYEYDIAWVFAKAVLETQSAKGIYVKPLIQQICYDMYGAGGWCRLNEYGDRYRLNYQIWGYYWDGTAHSQVYGFYDTDLGTITWNT